MKQMILERKEMLQEQVEDNRYMQIENKSAKNVNVV
jgi:hypothetical protein